MKGEEEGGRKEGRGWTAGECEVKERVVVGMGGINGEHNTRVQQ